MAQAKTKERRDQLASDIRRASNETSLAIRELLGLLMSEATDSLVSAIDRDEMLRLQGGVQTLLSLYKSLTVEPLSITRKGDNQ